MSIRIFKHDVGLPSLVLMAIEAGIAECALFLVAFQWNTALPGWRTAVFFAAIVVVASGAMGLYNMRLRTQFFGLALRYVLMASLALGIISLGLEAFPASRLSVSAYGYALTLTACFAFLARVLLGFYFHDGFLKSRVLVYGAGYRAAAITTRLRRRTDQLGFTIIGYLAVAGESRSIADDRVVDCSGDLLGFCQQNAIDEIVVAMDDRRKCFPAEDLLHCRVQGIEVLDVVDFLERETGSLRLDLLKPSWVIFSPGFEHSWISERVGRLLDMVSSFLLLLLAWPFMLLAMIAIKLEDGIHAPVMYRQQRVGKNGRIFTLLKFRSMQRDAEADGVARFASVDDSRVTRVGSWIRPSRIDELPQLWNVLRGDMRFVGPRPERPEFVSDYDKKLLYYRERHTVPPGLTGWAQLRYAYGSSEQDAGEKLKYDLYYIKNHNFVFDLVILIQTVEVILFGKGAR